MPQQYTLNLTIAPADLTTISAAGENIIIAKPVDNPLGAPSVAWLSFAPLENNKVQWTEQYAIYASDAPIQSGAVITQNSLTPCPASSGSCYELNNGVFTVSTEGHVHVPSGSYGVLNKMTSSAAMTFGLSQSANGAIFPLSPVNAELIPSNQQAIFTPCLTIWVWLQSSLSSGTVITGQFDLSSSSVGMAVSQPTVVSFGDGVTTQNLQYNSSQGEFVPA